VIGLLENTGGITEHFREILGIVNKETGAVVCYDPEPKSLLDRLEQIYTDRVLPRYVKALEGRDPDGVLEP